MALLHNSIGVSLYNNKEYAGANVEFSRAIFFNSKIAEFYVNRAKACIEMRTMPQAYEDLDKALKLNPNHQQANVLQQKFKPKTDARTLPANIVKLMARQRTK